MFEHGADLKVVSATLGHSSIRLTADVYAHLLPERSGEAAEAMQRALGWS
jgi:site-specific recombinase XerD